MQDFSLKVRNYKCFGGESGFTSIKRANLIIGRNNSGKSSLLDLIQISIDKTAVPEPDKHNGNMTVFVYESKISSQAIVGVFQKSTSGGEIRGNHGEFGDSLIDRKIKWSQVTPEVTNRTFIECDEEGLSQPLSNLSHTRSLLQKVQTPFDNKIFKRMFAERDIRQEPDNANLVIQSNGDGITNVFQKFINSVNYPSNLVENDLLAALNEIFRGDARFIDIVCQQLDNSYWEIFLEEEKKGRIALSKSGSGLKTVLGVLANLMLIPYIEKKDLNNFVFGFEELENNIHPALLRKLCSYIYESSVENDFIVFYTTHSNVLIDQFSKQKDAQIIHVRHKEASSSVHVARTYIDNNGILDDLDIRASDLLQANGIIWVEGPSDRVYLNRWISLWSDREFIEGRDYQIMFYGGRLLSHLSADDESNIQTEIEMLKINRNACILIDSDKKTTHTKLNATKKRLHNEFSDIGSLCWITKGKEIENYIPSEVVKEYLDSSSSINNVGQFESFFDYLDSIQSGEGSKFSKPKSVLADKLVPYMNEKNMKPMLDLDKKMRMLCDQIANWN